MAVTWTPSTDKPIDAFGSCRVLLGKATLTTSSADTLTTGLSKVYDIQATLDTGSHVLICKLNKIAAGTASDGSVSVQGTSGEVFNMQIMGV